LDPNPDKSEITKYKHQITNKFQISIFKSQTRSKLLSLDPVFNMPLSPTWSTLKVMLQNAPQALGAMTVGGAILGIPLAIISYYLSYAAVDKYQKDIKEKLARQKTKLAGTKEKVKKKMEERKIHKAEVKSQKADK
jgi:hypothetical protein